jgi:hypothetical protein
MWVKAREREKNKEKHVNGAMFLTIVRSSILLKAPFPRPNQARVTVNECFHEALSTECDGGTITEPGKVFVAGFTTPF